MMILSIDLNQQEKELAENYANLHNMSLEETFKHALFNQIEDKFDLTIANEAHEEYVKDGNISYPISELWGKISL